MTDANYWSNLEMENAKTDGSFVGDPSKTVAEQTGGAPIEDDSTVKLLHFITFGQHMLHMIDIMSKVLPITVLKEIDPYVKEAEALLSKLMA